MFLSYRKGKLLIHGLDSWAYFDPNACSKKSDVLFNCAASILLMQSVI